MILVTDVWENGKSYAMTTRLANVNFDDTLIRSNYGTDQPKSRHSFTKGYRYKPVNHS